MVIRKVDAATGIIRTVAGNAALTTYNGGYPLQQIDIQVPTGIGPGQDVAITPTAKGISTQAGVTLTVK